MKKTQFLSNEIVNTFHWISSPFSVFLNHTSNGKFDRKQKESRIQSIQTNNQYFFKQHLYRIVYTYLLVVVSHRYQNANSRKLRPFSVFSNFQTIVRNLLNGFDPQRHLTQQIRKSEKRNIARVQFPSPEIENAQFRNSDQFN